MRGPDPGRERRWLTEPAAEILRPEPDLVPDHRSGQRNHCLDGPARASRLLGTAMGTQTPATASVPDRRNLRSPCPVAGPASLGPVTLGRDHPGRLRPPRPASRPGRIAPGPVADRTPQGPWHRNARPPRSTRGDPSHPHATISSRTPATTPDTAAQQHHERSRLSLALGCVATRVRPAAPITICEELCSSVVTRR